MAFAVRVSEADEVAGLAAGDRAFRGDAMLGQTRDRSFNARVEIEAEQDGASSTRGWVVWRGGMQADDEALTGAHGGPVVAEAIGELEAENLGVKANRYIHVGDDDCGVAVGDHCG